jgi:hypothetical protein
VLTGARCKHEHPTGGKKVTARNADEVYEQIRNCLSEKEQLRLAEMIVHDLAIELGDDNPWVLDMVERLRRRRLAQGA